MKAFVIQVHVDGFHIGYVHFRDYYLLGGRKRGAAVWKGEKAVNDFILKNDFVGGIELKPEELTNN